MTLEEREPVCIFVICFVCLLNVSKKPLCVFFTTGLSVRSVCWQGERILVGTNAGEVFEVMAKDKDNPRTIVQVCSDHCTVQYYAIPYHTTPYNSVLFCTVRRCAVLCCMCDSWTIEPLLSSGK